MPDNPLSDFTKNIGADVSNLRKELPERFKTVILAGVALGATLQCNQWLTAVFDKIFSGYGSILGKFLHLCLWIVALAVATVKLSTKKLEENKDKSCCKCCCHKVDK